MSYPIWTAEELLSNAVPAEGICWRLVEGQHEVSTMKLVDTLAEQQRLEEILEDNKPAFPEHSDRLHYLLKTPFRYQPYKGGSRFRREGQREGAFYASKDVETSVAEMAFYRVLFFSESPDTPLPDNASQYTAFSVQYGAQFAIDLTVPPLNQGLTAWTNPFDYQACQSLADRARDVGVQIIFNTSVRCPMNGATISLISCEAFQEVKPGATQTWGISVKKTEVLAICEFPRKRLQFSIADFARKDSRVQVPMKKK